MYNKNDMKQFNGVWALLLTPFQEDRSIDFNVLEQYAEWQAANKPQHIFAVCGSAEMTSLNIEERIKIATIAAAKAGSVPVVATANLEPSWLAQVEEVKRMAATGVSGLVFVTKGYGNDQNRMFAYLTELSTYTNLPIMLYECPAFSPSRMEAETYGKLVQTGRFVSIKDTTCTMPAIKEKIAVQGESSVLQANIPYLFEAYQAGARGVCATTTTCGTHLFVKMWDEFSNGRVEEARKTHEHICWLDNAIDSGFCATAKYLVNLQGIPMNWFTRGNQELNPQRLKALDVWYEWAKEYGIM
ncbi:MAG: dihydrodipicolinate synthase family protein [Eubacteriales bacterium]